MHPTKISASTYTTSAFQFTETDNEEARLPETQETHVDNDIEMIETFEDVRQRISSALPNLEAIWNRDSGIVIMLMRFVESATSFTDYFPLVMFVEALKRRFAEKEGFQTPAPSRETSLLFTWWYRYVHF